LTERVVIPVTMDDGFRARIVVEAQLQTYLRMNGIPVGLIFNVNASRPIDGLRRFVV
jgi:hypothetical protein